MSEDIEKAINYYAVAISHQIHLSGSEVINMRILLPSLKNQIKQLESDKAELMEALTDVVRISDRKHIAWDRAKVVLKKMGQQVSYQQTRERS